VEVEQVLNSHAAIVQSAVVGREVADNEEVVAFVEVKAGMDPDLQELRQWLRAQLSPYKVPSEIRIVPALPAAPTGKILKHVLKHWAAARRVIPAPANGRDTPRDALNRPAHLGGASGAH
jgi:acyl-coenzyme A synthetase/AMP-(fatty) acid ligase